MTLHAPSIIVCLSRSVLRISCWEKKLTKGVLASLQLGEFFGGAVSALDVNGDGLDDLAVGAPTYSITGEGNILPDQGRFAVYLNTDLVRTSF